MKTDLLFRPLQLATIIRRRFGLVVACAFFLGVSRITDFGLTVSSAGFAVANPQSESRSPAAAGNPKSTEGPRFSVPKGFVVERIDRDFEIRFPMFAAFADDGRLFVAESSGLDLYAELQTGARNSRISMLTDGDGDGHFDTACVFADKLVCPMGLAWRDGTLYVADPPDVVAFTDNDNDGRADHRQVILTGFGHETNGSLHGLVFGPDGMLYMTMGSPDGYALKRADGSVLSGNSGALIRCKPDGSDPEVLNRGFVNLIEVAFTARGDIVGTDNWFQQPKRGLRDALVHLIDGGLYPYLPDGGTHYPYTGTVLPPIALYPAVALSGLLSYQGSAFPDTMRGDLFSAQFNARKIVRHRLVPRGATFQSTDEDFLTTDDPDFHPSDVVESADGSLIVIDTGSWYVQHCPTGRIRPIDAPGGIYRIHYAEADHAADPWGRKIDADDLSPDQLATLLDDPRPAVRKLAERTLVARGAPSVPALASILERETSTVAKQHAIWVLSAIPDASALLPLRNALDANDLDVIIPALRALAHRGDTKPTGAFERLLTYRNPSVRLAAAEALARVGKPASIPALWQALAGKADPFLNHALIHAIHCLADAPALQSALQHQNPKIQMAALLLLDQPPRPFDSLRPDDVLTRLNVPYPGLRRVARDTLARHPEWADQATDFLRALLESPVIVQEDESDLGKLVLVFERHKEVQELIAAAIGNERGNIPLVRQVQLLELVSRSSLTELPRSWIDAIGAVVDRAPLEVRLAAVRSAAVLQINALDDQLDQLANSPDVPSPLRREALRAILPRRSTLSPAAFNFLIEDIAADADPLLRLAAAESFANARLDGEQLSTLLHTIQGDSLISPAVLLPMFVRSTTSGSATRVVEYLEATIGAGWRPPRDAFANLVEVLSQPDRQRLEVLLHSSHENVEQLQARLAKYLPLLEHADAERGRAVFFSTKATCSTCHHVAGEGGHIGPELTSIGAIRSARDLVESILLPSSTIAQEFEQYTVLTTSGRVISGIVTEQTGQTITLRDSAGAQSRFRKNEIEEMTRQPVSLMPDGLERSLTPQELGDVVAFLLSLR
jgi:putative membrane-bound dehydrogenase-like protein